jgi:hypothetical protein
MARNEPRAGGFFLTAAILIGFAWGVAAGDVMKGVLAGSGVGILIVLTIWLAERRRG